VDGGQITSFKGEHAFLSNFYKFDGRITTEHIFQSLKTEHPLWQTFILDAEEPGDAKTRGRMAPMREGWDDMRVAVMSNVLKIKFRPGSVMLQKLIDTGDAELIEGNWWGDKFWGVCDGTGLNHLGKELMKIRRFYSGQ
jgi:predicted NAD-dependent protein-ADP-ribosyltransferase YbiA (DUF1768 family)